MANLLIELILIFHKSNSGLNILVDTRIFYVEILRGNSMGIIHISCQTVISVRFDLLKIYSSK